MIQSQLEEARDAGKFKDERIIATPQDAEIRLTHGQEVLNLCTCSHASLITLWNRFEQLLGIEQSPEDCSSCSGVLDHSRVWIVLCEVHLRDARYPQTTGEDD